MSIDANMSSEQIARDLVEGAGGSVDFVSGPLPDGSGFLTASFPLPKGHWLYAEGTGPHGSNVPPMGLRVGADQTICVTLTREALTQKVLEAARYAVRCATFKGSDSDFDPDALVRNVVTGLLGYHTADGTSDLDRDLTPEEMP